MKKKNLIISVGIRKAETAAIIIALAHASCSSVTSVPRGSITTSNERKDQQQIVALRYQPNNNLHEIQEEYLIILRELDIKQGVIFSESYLSPPLPKPHKKEDNYQQPLVAAFIHRGVGRRRRPRRIKKEGE